MTWTALIESAEGVDQNLFQRMAPQQTSLPGRKWNGLVSRLADGPWYFLVALLPFTLGHANAMFFFTAMAVGFAIELPAYKLIKHYFRRSRPCDALENTENLLPIPDTYSFPSGHTAGAFVLAGITVKLFPPLALPAYLFAIAVGYSRVYNRLHFPADIFAGAALGSFCAFVGITVAGGVL